MKLLVLLITFMLLMGQVLASDIIVSSVNVICDINPACEEYDDKFKELVGSYKNFADVKSSFKYLLLPSLPSLYMMKNLKN